MIKVPKYAKKNAKKGLKLRKKLFKKGNRPALSRKKANKLGITSGLDTARTLIRSKNISKKKAKQIYGFLRRNVPRRGTKKDDVNDLIWGDDEQDRFEKYLKRQLKK